MNPSTIRSRLSRALVPVLALAAAPLAAPPSAGADLRRDFEDPPFDLRPRPLWFWNGPLTAAGIREQMERSKESGYGGFGILPSPGMTPPYMSAEYLDLYGVAVRTAAELGQKLTLYDEYWFPSGSAGGEMAARHPERLAKRLDMAAEDVRGPAAYRKALPAGRLMAAVAMEAGTKERVDLAASVRAGALEWSVPAGTWKVMVFTCVHDGARGLVDYLDPDAVRRFVELTHERYYARFAPHFGTTIAGAFYDEPTFHWVGGGRAWTGEFNAKFEKARGFDPAPWYPALWLDIGPDTEAARCALFGFRAELYATGFPKVLDDWCAAHGIASTGHVDQEEVVNPVGLCGDLMKAFRHQSIPGLDSIFQYGRGSRMYKIVASAAVNWDRPRVMTEVYGAMGEGIGVPAMYREAMDELAKGVNLFVPHAIWYENRSVGAPPELSWRSARYGPALPELTLFLARAAALLGRGAPVADVAVLYPIATLEAGYRFDGGGPPYEGHPIPPEADYMDVGEALSLDVRRDFTYLHPEALETKCAVEGDRLVLRNVRLPQTYRVLVLPGSRTVAASTLAAALRLFEGGGAVIATTMLPSKSAEFGKDAEVREAVRRIFGPSAGGGAAPAVRASASSSWTRGGYGPELAVDGRRDTRWNAAEGTSGGQWLEVDLGRPLACDGVRIREAFDRVTAHRIQTWDGARWVDRAAGGAIGRDRTVSFEPTETSRVRLCIDAISSDSASIAEIDVLAGGRSVLAGPEVRNASARGGKAVFLPRPLPAALRAALDEAVPVPDVRIGVEGPLPGGNLSYIHKVVEGRQVYFFANSSDRAIDAAVEVRGDLRLEAWDPHTGKIGPVEMERRTAGGEAVTRARLRLPAVRCVFLVSADGKAI